MFVVHATLLSGRLKFMTGKCG